MKVRSKGSWLLARTEKSQDAIASDVEVSRVTVSYWQTGKKKPSDAKRKALLTQYEIPPESWDEPHGGRVLSAKTASRPPGEILIPRGIFEKAAMLETMADELITEMKRDADSTPLEKAKVMNQLSSCLTQLAKMTGQFELGGQLFRSPIWKRIEEALATGLRGHPEAAAAVGAQLRQAEAESGLRSDVTTKV